MVMLSLEYLILILSLRFLMLLISSFLCSCFSVVVLTTNGGIFVVFGVILDVLAAPRSSSVGSWCILSSSVDVDSLSDSTSYLLCVVTGGGVCLYFLCIFDCLCFAICMYCTDSMPVRLCLFLMI